MHSEEIQKHADALSDELVATGRGSVSVEIGLRSHAGARAVVHYGDWVMNKPGSDYKVISRPTLDEAIAAAADYIRGLPSTQEENQKAFMRNVGKLLDEARQQGIDAAFVNPLEVLMKSLSENVITYRKDGNHDD